MSGWFDCVVVADITYSTILDDSDWEMAIECARVEAETKQRSYGSLEVHCAQRV